MAPRFRPSRCGSDVKKSDGLAAWDVTGGRTAWANESRIPVLHDLTTFSLTGEENYMRAAVGDLDQDGCLDIIAGSKSAKGTSGDIRWWHCPTGTAFSGPLWIPEIWKSGAKADMQSRSHLRDLWGQHRLIAGDIHWVMEMVVTDLAPIATPWGTSASSTRSGLTSARAGRRSRSTPTPRSRSVGSTSGR